MKAKDVFPGVFSRHAEAYRDRVLSHVPVGRLKVLESVAAQPGERALDLACGPGTLTLRLADAVGPQGRVLAIDLADGMLELLKAAAPPWVETQRMDIEQMHLPSGAFDVVTCGHGYQFVPDLSHALREARRVLAPGGRFAASVPGTRLSTGIRELLGDVLDDVPPAPPILDRDETVATLQDEAALGETLTSAGFSDVLVRQYDEEISYDDVESMVKVTLRWWDFAWRLEQVGLEERSRLVARLTQAMRERVTEFPFVTTGSSTVFSGRG